VSLNATDRHVSFNACLPRSSQVKLLQRSLEGVCLLRYPRSKLCRMRQERTVSAAKRPQIPIHAARLYHHLLRHIRNRLISETVHIGSPTVELGAFPSWWGTWSVHRRIRLETKLADCDRITGGGHVVVENVLWVFRKYLPIRLPRSYQSSLTCGSLAKLLTWRIIHSVRTLPGNFPMRESPSSATKAQMKMSPMIPPCCPAACLSVLLRP